MKIKFHYIVLMACIFALVSCKKDTYKAPSSTLSGRLVYNGDPIGIEYNQVPFNLFQSGYGLVGPITGTFTPDGLYSTLLFNGTYKFTIPPGQGPFRWKENASGGRDTVLVTVNGNTTMDIQVTPYYMIRTPQLTVGGGKVSGTFKIEKVITDANAKDIDRVSLYINKTQFVSGADNIASVNLAGSAITDPNNVTLSVTLPSITPTQNYVYARIGIKIAGAEDMIFSPLQKLQF
jgi:hypothetical protein